MNGESKSDHCSTLATWLDLEDAPLDTIQELIQKSPSTNVIEYLKLEAISELKKQGDYRYREVNYLQQELKKFHNDFSKAFNECKWSRIKDVFDMCAYLLSTRAYNAIRLLHFLSPNEFNKFINEHVQPLWLFPLLEEKELSRSNVKELLPALQAVYAFIHYENAKTGKEKVSSIFGKLEKNLNRRDWIVTSALMLEELIRESFPIKNQSIKKETSGLKDEVFKWLVTLFSEQKLTDEEIDTFLLNLTGRVNRESWIGALFLANLLDNQDTECSIYNAELLRVKVLDQYSSLWKKNNVKTSKNYFHGEMSIELISELATAFYASKSNSVSYLLNNDVVDKPEKLWHYRNSHRYDQYLDNRIQCFVNILVITLVIEKYVEEIGDLPTEWNQYIELFLSYVKQWNGRYINDGEELILSELFSRIGNLTGNSNQLLHVAPVVFSYFPIPKITMNLMKNIEAESENFLFVKQLIEESIKVHVIGMRQSSVIELVENLYKMSVWNLTVQLCEEIQFNRIKDANTKIYLAKIYALSVLNLIYQLDNEENKINILRRAYETLGQIRQDSKYYKDSHFEILFGYIIGEMINNNLVNYSAAVINFLNENNSRNVEDEFSETLAYVKSGLIIHLISSDQVLLSEYLPKLEFELDLARRLPDIEGIVYLMDAWVAERLSKFEVMNSYLNGAKKYIDQICQAKDMLPTPLLPLALSVMEGDEYASRP
ncbi:hypothetical protein ACQKN7_10345 [Bacillus cereus]|uniref:hypothetical protein n=1 Tax=Bacillus cereus TaxID=1396 RepID=UPI003CFCBCED